MKYFLTLSQIYTSIQTNYAIHFLSKIPVVNKLIQPSLYRQYGFKKIFAVLGILLDFIRHTLGNNIGTYFLIFLLPHMILPDKLETAGVWIGSFLVLKCLVAPVLECNIFKSKAEDDTFLHHFMLEPSHYYRYKTLKQTVYDGLLIFPVLYFVLRDPLLTAALVAVKIASLLGGNVFYLAYYRKHQCLPKVLSRRLVGLTIAIASYVCVFCGIYTRLVISVPMAWSLFAGSCVVILYSWIYHCRFTEFKDIAVQFADHGVILFRVTANDSVGEDVSGIQEEPWGENKKFFEAHKELSMANYMDAAFAHRYGKGFRKGVWDQVAFVLGLLGILALAIRFHVLPVNAENILSYSPVLITLTATITIAHRLSAMYFRCIDLHLMYNHLCTPEFFKESILKRYVFTLRYDLAIGAALAAGVLGFLLIAGIKLPVYDFLLVNVASFLMLLLWETYGWCVYYIVQPYSADLMVKSPVFKVLGTMETIFDLLVLFIRKDLTMAIPMILCLLVLTAAVLFSCPKWAYQHFKLKT